MIQAMERFKKVFPLVIVILACVALGMFGRPLLDNAMGKSDKPEPKVPITPVPFAEPLIINLTGPQNTDPYLKIGVAVELAPMTEAKWEELAAHMGAVGGGGHHGGSDGVDMDALAVKIGSDPVLHDALITTASTFGAQELLTNQGRVKLRQALTQSMNRAEQSSHGKPRFTVTSVLFTSLIVQR